MPTRNSRLLVYLTFAALTTFARAAEAHHTGEHAVTLNTNRTWTEECAMVVSPALTQADFAYFTKDISSMLYFRPMGGAQPLGAYQFDIGLELARTAQFKDYHPAWNNTFSHPDAEHWLTEDHYLKLPFLSAHMGVTDAVDVGLGATKNFGANYGWVSADVKYAFVQKEEYNLAVRGALSSLFGVRDYSIQQGSVDLLASRTIRWFTPYVGATAILTTASETTAKVDLERVNHVSVEGLVGLQATWKHVNVAAEADIARVNMYAFKIGTMF